METQKNTETQNSQKKPEANARHHYPRFQVILQSYNNKTSNWHKKQSIELETHNILKFI